MVPSLLSLFVAACAGAADSVDSSTTDDQEGAATAEAVPEVVRCHVHLDTTTNDEFFARDELRCTFAENPDLFATSVQIKSSRQRVASLSSTDGVGVERALGLRRDDYPVEVVVDMLHKSDAPRIGALSLRFAIANKDALPETAPKIVELPFRMSPVTVHSRLDNFSAEGTYELDISPMVFGSLHAIPAPTETKRTFALDFRGMTYGRVFSRVIPYGRGPVKLGAATLEGPGEYLASPAGLARKQGGPTIGSPFAACWVDAGTATCAASALPGGTVATVTVQAAGAEPVALTATPIAIGPVPAEGLELVASGTLPATVGGLDFTGTQPYVTALRVAADQAEAAPATAAFPVELAVFEVECALQICGVDTESYDLDFNVEWSRFLSAVHASQTALLPGTSPQTTVLAIQPGATGVPVVVFTFENGRQTEFRTVARPGRSIVTADALTPVE
jgi:hypothetical protein